MPNFLMFIGICPHVDIQQYHIIARLHDNREISLAGDTNRKKIMQIVHALSNHVRMI